MASDVALVGTSLMSVLFLLEGRLIDVCWLEISIRFLGSQPVSGYCSATRPNQPPPLGSMQGIPDSVSGRSGKNGTTVRQAQEVATRHEMEE